MNELSRDFERIVENLKRFMFTAPSSQNDHLSAVAGNGLVGRPRLQITYRYISFYNKILDRDWFSAHLFATLSAHNHVGVQLQVSNLNLL